MGLFVWDNDIYDGYEKAKHKYPRINFNAKNSMMMGSVLALALTIAITILLVTHFYFSFTSHTSIESGMLMDFNPYFESNLSEEENRNYATE